MDRRRKTQAVTWWGDVTGPSQFVDEVVFTLNSGKSALISAQLPFHETFIQSVADELRVAEGALVLDEPITTEQAPGTYLIELYNISDGYRPHRSAAEYLKKSGKLSSRLVHVIEDGNNVDKWIDFIQQYKSDALSSGLFLVETHGEVKSTSSKTIQAIDYRQYITGYDSLMFAGLISDPKLSMPARRYVSALAASLFDTNAEDIAAFAERYEISMNPFDVLPDRISPMDSTLRLWNAQIQELFSLIMQETHTFIKKWKTQIDEAFEYIHASKAFSNSLFPQGLMNAYGEQVNSHEDLELSTLRFLMHKRCRDEHGYETNDYVLYIPSDTARERLELLYDMRNTIAHGKVCAENDVARLLLYK